MKIVNSDQPAFYQKLLQSLTLFLFFLLFLSMLAGCGSSVSLNKQIRSSKQPVSISRDVDLPETMFYQGLGDFSMAPMFGIAGIMVEMATDAENKGSFKAVDVVMYVMEKSKIDLKEIVLTEFEQQIESSNLFTAIVVEGNNYPKFKLSIYIYGLAQPHGLSAQLKPLLGIIGVLVNTDGSILWKYSDYVTNLSSQTASHTAEEYIADPELLRNAFEQAASIAVSNLVNHMKGE